MGPNLENNALYRNIYSFFSGFLPDTLDWLAYLLTGLILVMLLINALMMFTALQVYLERRLIGRFQTRLGPNRVGPFGLLQPFADVLKLMIKEDTRPANADRLSFSLAPVLIVGAVLGLVAVVPFGKNSFLTNMNVGILFFIAVTTIATLAIFIGGWGSGNRFALLGAVRAVAMLISYEVPMVLSLVGVLLITGSMSLVEVVEAQRLPFLILQPIGFFVFAAAATAEINRSPFDLLEAESELTAGFHTEYSGMKFGLIQLAEFAEVVVISAILATLFLRGWENPFVPIGWIQILPSHLWFVLKILFFIFLFVWIRATVPRLRVDQVMGFAWKVLFPLSIVNLLVTASMVVIWPEPTTSQLWIMVGINWSVAIVCLIGWTRRLEKNRKRPTATVKRVEMASEVE